MQKLPFRHALAWTLALTGGLLLNSCSSEPTATEADKTATVVSEETNTASDSAATTAPADSAGTGATTGTMQGQ